MFGLAVWYIHQNKDGKTYYYKESKPEKGIRFWTSNKDFMHFFMTEEDALHTWKEMGQPGKINGIYV